MVRAKSTEKLERILDAAAETFLDLGYRGTRIDEVTSRASVSAGTLYLYATSKEALFELVLRRALGDQMPDPGKLPFEGSGPGGDLIDWVWARFVAISPQPELERITKAPRPADPIGEFEQLLRGAWGWMAEYWQAIELIERCAKDWPELHMLYFKQFRRGVFASVEGYLSRRMDEGALRRYPDASTAQRVIVESLAFFAMHRHVRPDSAHLEEDTCRETVIHMLLAAFDPKCD